MLTSLKTDDSIYIDLLNGISILNIWKIFLLSRFLNIWRVKLNIYLLVWYMNNFTNWYCVITFGNNQIWQFHANEPRCVIPVSMLHVSYGCVTPRVEFVMIDFAVWCLITLVLYSLMCPFIINICINDATVWSRLFMAHVYINNKNR